MTTAFMILLNQGNAFPVGTTFVPMLCTAIRLKSMPDYEAFLEYYFQRNIDDAVSKLKKRQPVSIPIFKSKLKKIKICKKNTLAITRVLMFFSNHLLP